MGQKRQTTQQPKIGRRIESLLRSAEDPNSTDNIESSVHTARKAETLGLIRITYYRDDNYQPIPENQITNATKFSWVHFELTEKGKELKTQLDSGAVKIHDTQREEQLSWLLHQSGCLHYSKTADPDKSYTWDTEVQFLKDLGNAWMRHATNRLQIPLAPRHRFLYSNHDHYDSPELNNGLFCEIIAEDHIFPIDITISLQTFLGANEPVSLSLALNVQYNAREFFRRAMTDYPRVLSDILDYGGSLKFQCHVPLNNEPKGRKTKTIDWFKAYFAPDEDDDEKHFFLEVRFTPLSTHAHVRKNFLAMVALYDSALNSLNPSSPSPDMLLDYHKILCRQNKSSQLSTKNVPT